MAIENIFLIIFILMILSRIFGKKSSPPPRRGQRSPADIRKEPEQATRYGSGDIPDEQMSTRRPSPVARKNPEDEFFPIPDDLRDIFGLPPVEKEESKLKPIPEPEPVIVTKREIMPAREKVRPSVTTATEVFSPESLTGFATGSTLPPVPGLKFPLEKNAVIQGIIWAEVLHNPRTRRARKYGPVGRL